MNKLMVMIGVVSMVLCGYSETEETIDGINYQYDVIKPNGDVYNFAEWIDNEGTKWKVFRDKDAMDDSVQYCIQCYNDHDNFNNCRGIGLWFKKDEMTDKFVPNTFYAYTRDVNNGGLCQTRFDDKPTRSWAFTKTSRFSMAIDAKFILHNITFSKVTKFRIRYENNNDDHVVDTIILTSGKSKISEALKKVSKGKDTFEY